MECSPYLFEVADAVNRQCFRPRFIQSRKQHCRKNGDDGYNDQKLYQCKISTFPGKNQPGNTDFPDFVFYVGLKHVVNLLDYDYLLCQ